MSSSYSSSLNSNYPQIKSQLPRIRVKTDIPKIDLICEFEIIWDFDFKK